MNLLLILTESISNEVGVHASLVVKVKLKLWRLSKDLIALLLYIHRWVKISLVWELENDLRRLVWVNMNVICARRRYEAILRVLKYLRLELATHLRLLKLNLVKLLLILRNPWLWLLFKRLGCNDEALSRISHLLAIYELIQSELMSNWDSPTVPKYRIFVVYCLNLSVS